MLTNSEQNVIALLTALATCWLIVITLSRQPVTRPMLLAIIGVMLRICLAFFFAGIRWQEGSAVVSSFGAFVITYGGLVIVMAAEVLKNYSFSLTRKKDRNTHKNGKSS